MEIKHRLDVGKLLRHLGMVGDTAEVGAAEMYFSADMLRWDMGKHYIIDLWGNIPGQAGDGGQSDEWHSTNYQKGIERIKEFGDRAIILQGMSVDMAVYIPDNSLVCVNIDCDHSLEGCRNDINAYWGKLVSGGIMIFHDFEQPQYGVKQAVTEFSTQHGLEIHLLCENKAEDAGAFLIKK